MTSKASSKTQSESERSRLTSDEEVLFREWIEKLSHTREFHQAMSILLPEIIEQVIKPWTGNHHVKQVLVRFIHHLAQKSFERSETNVEQKGLMELLKDSDELSKLIGAIPSIVNQMTEWIARLSKTVEGLPVEEQERLIKHLIEGFNFQRNGEIFNRFIKILNEIHANNPAFITDLFGPNITYWLEQVDFGELSECVDCFAEDIETLGNQTFDAFFQFPGKLILLISFLPVIINLLARLIYDALKHFNTMAPDLACDVVLSFMNEIDGNTFGELFNQLNELVRKINTGSALLGDPGAPQFPISASRMAESFIQAVDRDLLLKARTAIIEMKANVEHAYIDQLSAYHEDLIAQLKLSTSIINHRNELRLKLLSTFDAISDEQLETVLEKGGTEFNAQNFAEMINNYCAFVNRARNLKPQLFSSTIQDFFSSLDIDEVKETFDFVMATIEDEAQPMAKAILPGIIEQVKKWIA
jgi:hypothetical protein